MRAISEAYSPVSFCLHGPVPCTSRHLDRGAGRRRGLVFVDRVLVTLAHLRLDLTRAALAELFDVDRCTVTKVIGEIRPLPAARGLATFSRFRLRTLADVFAYAQADGVRLRLDGTEIQVRRPAAHRPGRRRFVSGKRRKRYHGKREHLAQTIDAVASWPPIGRPAAEYAAVWRRRT
ncbi:transposase family protein [Nonomuraea sp. SYSU D8015]|uniref:transposase family protein n=1 Tax=Nonomuraea sp. SYSU D8015 TaxID=2593644 RepID=UPI001CB6EC5C|nr:transposase family protein [Nonomuraea sp. SYSU D8015]